MTSCDALKNIKPQKKQLHPDLPSDEDPVLAHIEAAPKPTSVAKAVAATHLGKRHLMRGEISHAAAVFERLRTQSTWCQEPKNRARGKLVAWMLETPAATSWVQGRSQSLGPRKVSHRDSTLDGEKAMVLLEAWQNASGDAMRLQRARQELAQRRGPKAQAAVAYDAWCRSDLPVAREACQKALSKRPDDLLARNVQVLIELSAGKFDVARDLVGAVLDRHPYDEIAQALAAIVALRCGDVVEARETLEQLAPKHKTLFELWARAEVLHASSSNATEVASLLDRLLRRDPSFYPGWVLRAKLHMERGDYRACLSDLDTASAGRSEPYDSDLLMLRYQACMLLGDKDKAADAAMRACDDVAVWLADPKRCPGAAADTLVGLLIEADEAMQARAYMKAIERYSAALTGLDASCCAPQVHARLGEALQAAGEEDEAAENFELAGPYAKSQRFKSAAKKHRDVMDALSTRLDALAKAIEDEGEDDPSPQEVVNEAAQIKLELQSFASDVAADPKVIAELVDKADAARCFALLGVGAEHLVQVCEAVRELQTRQPHLPLWQIIREKAFMLADTESDEQTQTLRWKALEHTYPEASEWKDHAEEVAFLKSDPEVWLDLLRQNPHKYSVRETILSVVRDDGSDAHLLLNGFLKILPHDPQALLMRLKKAKTIEAQKAAVDALRASGDIGIAECNAEVSLRVTHLRSLFLVGDGKTNVLHEANVLHAVFGDEPEINQLLGDIYKKKNLFVRARQCYDRADNHVARIAVESLFSECYKGIDAPNVRALIKQSLDAYRIAYPHDIEALIVLGNIYLNEDSLRTARDCFVQASKMAPASKRVADGLNRSSSWAQTQKVSGSIWGGVCQGGAVIFEGVKSMCKTVTPNKT